MRLYFSKDINHIFLCLYSILHLSNLYFILRNVVKATFKGDKATRSSENGKIMIFIILSIIVNYIICIIKLWVGSGYARNLRKNP